MGIVHFSMEESELQFPEKGFHANRFAERDHSLLATTRRQTTQREVTYQNDSFEMHRMFEMIKPGFVLGLMPNQC